MFFKWFPRVHFNPPDPLFKGAIRACGLSIATVPALPASSGPASEDALLIPQIPFFYPPRSPYSRGRSGLFVVAGGFEAFGVLGYLELVDTFLDITVHEGREIVH